MSANHPATTATTATTATSPPTTSPPPPPPSTAHPHPEPPRRTRPRLTDQIQVIRELWVLREQARVQAAERCFLTELERLISGPTYHTTTSPAPPQPPVLAAGMPHLSTSTTASSSIPNPPPLPPLPPSSLPAQSPTPVSSLADGFVFESNPPPRGDSAPAREQPWAASLEMEQARASQRVTVSGSNNRLFCVRLQRKRCVLVQRH